MITISNVEQFRMELNKISEEIDKRFFLIVSDEIYFFKLFC